MAPEASSRRRRRSGLEDDDDEDSVRYGERSPSTTSEMSKRQRLSESTDPESDDDIPPPSTNGHPANGVFASQGSDGFQPGAIVRVKVQNFVTYEDAEFFPGPNLNMVIGPNGTGKSSLVCAICLGLGYSPKHLGRATSVKEFVKHGKDVATIETELRGFPQDRGNFVIRVQIRRDKNNLKWWLNGKETQHKGIQKLVSSLKIQIDNLCQFLPQDRVVEFAGCTPVDLLHETLRAAAPIRMIKEQEALKDLQKNQTTLTQQVEQSTGLLQNLQNRQDGLQADVQRLKERDDIQLLIENLNLAIPVAEYYEARNIVLELKAQKREAMLQLEKLKADCEPSLRAVNDKERYRAAVENGLRGRKQAMDEAVSAADRLLRDVNRAEEEAEQISSQMDVEGSSFDAKKKELASCRARINALESRQRQEPPRFDAAEWNQKIRAEEHQMRDQVAEKGSLLEELQKLRQEGRPKQEEIHRFKRDLKDLDTKEGQQLSWLKRNKPDVAAAYEWLRNHESEFSAEVFGPPALTCSVKDERYSDQVQSLLQNDDFLCFTAQNAEDHRKLSDQFHGKMNLSVAIRSCLAPLSNFRPPMPRDALQNLGLDGFAIDFLAGPDRVLAMLCSEKRLHQACVALTDVGSREYEQLVASEVINHWSAGRQLYRVTRRREYGAGAVSTTTQSVRNGIYWKQQQADSSERSELERGLAQAEDELQQMQVRNKELKAQMATFDSKEAAIRKKIEDLRKEKAEIQKEYNVYLTLPDKIENENRALGRCRKELGDLRTKMRELGMSRDKTLVERAKLVMRHKDATAKIVEAQRDVLEAQIMMIEADSDVTGLKLRVSDTQKAVDEATSRKDALDKEHADAKDKGKALQTRAASIYGEYEDRRETLRQLSEGKTSEQLKNEVEAEEAKLSLIHSVDPNLMREFDRRAQEIDKTRRRLDIAAKKLDSLNTEAEEIRASWEPRLDSLIAEINVAFSHNFEQINCKGEVRVNKTEDFGQWALEILVSFRPDEPLQPLDQHRQSGGERAVSTIFYLMSLQSMAQSPFRVVDEINQGMDPRNERMVHERMVEIACQEHTSQYFLITPKLLTGLRYHPKMRVLCIASGEHIPSQGKKLDFRRCLKVQKRLMAAA